MGKIFKNVQRKKIEFFGKEISGLFTIPSGIVTTKASTLERIANEVPEIGILTTKSIGIEPREGNREPIIAQYGPLSFINAVGLTNPGAEEFAERLSKIKIPDNKFLLVSIFGSCEEEFVKVAEKLRDYADGFEINISCPHSEKYGQAVGQDRGLVKKIIRNVVFFGKPVFIKISPNLDIKKTVKCIVESGASGITAINTRGPELYLHDSYPVLSNRVGGVSGKAVLKLGIKCVREIREITDLPIIACGGISTTEDVRRYKEAGADFFGVGSALAGMNTEEIKRYFYELLLDLDTRTDKASAFLKRKLPMDYEKYRVVENKKLDEELFLIKLNKDITIEAGQFIFAWIPKEGEKPFSVFNDKPLVLLIRKRGNFTGKLVEIKSNEIVYIRGPYGNSPKTKGKVLLVGGGTGIAALYLFAKKNKETVILFGAKNKRQLTGLEFSGKSYFTTEDGEIGSEGLVTDILEEVIKKEQPNFCINCGPEGMVKTAIQIEKRYINPENIYSSIDFLTRCGIGLCGSCTTSKGYRSCVDGTFLKNNQL